MLITPRISSFLLINVILPALHTFLSCRNLTKLYYINLGGIAYAMVATGPVVASSTSVFREVDIFWVVEISVG